MFSRIPDRKNFSFWALIVSILFIFIFRATHINEKEISWDVFGYYLPLQATFIEDDPMLEDISWIDQTIKEKELAGTMYFVASNQDGKAMYFFFFGMSIMYALFFFVGHGFAALLGFPQDGLSPPYQYALIFGCMLYTIIGLIHLRKILKLYFSESVTAVVLLMLVFATNYSHHMTLKNLETVNVIFMFAAIIIWNTIKWYESHRFINMLFVGLSLIMLALIKPSEILFGLVPFFWSVHNWTTMKARFAQWWNYRKQIVSVIIICFFVGFPQSWYWHHLTGQWLFDSYQNPGVGLDLFSPHIFDSLFSYRKGWLLYTPAMIFALIGFGFLYKRNKQLFFGIFIPFIIAFYIIASWTEFWYGAGFSNRPVIAQYPLLAIPLAYFVQYIFEQKMLLKVASFSVFSFCLFLNQFQWWQMRNFIWDPYRTTKDFYWAIFLKTEREPADQKLLLVNRDFSGIQRMDHPELYSSRRYSFDASPAIDPSKEYTMDKRFPYSKLSDRDHIWIEYNFEYMLPTKGSNINLCVKFERKEGMYGDRYFPLSDSLPGEWQTMHLMYMTPEIRSENDVLQVFFWNQTKGDFKIRNFEIRIHEENWRVIKK